MDTAQALHPAAKQAQHGIQTAEAEKAAEGMDPSAGLLPSMPIVATVEYGGQAVALQSLAVNKDCVAVAGLSPVVRSTTSS